MVLLMFVMCLTCGVTLCAGGATNSTEAPVINTTVINTTSAESGEDNEVAVEMETRMYNGTVIPHSRYPFFVYWYYDRIDISGCSGAMVSDEMVLTAAHCFNEWNGNVSSIAVWWRVTDISFKNGIKLRVKAVYKHDLWLQRPYGWASDLALIHINKADFKGIRPGHLKFPLPGMDLQYIDSKKMVTIIAMGYSIPRRNDQFSVLKEASFALRMRSCGSEGLYVNHELCGWVRYFKLCAGEYIHVLVCTV